MLLFIYKACVNLVYLQAGQVVICAGDWSKQWCKMILRPIIRIQTGARFQTYTCEPEVADLSQKPRTKFCF